MGVFRDAAARGGTGRAGPSCRPSPEEPGELACFLVGTAAQVRDILRARRERWGFDYVTVPAAAAEPFAPVVAGLKRQ
ncbi:hypothetical protein [Streptomyces avermitilis]|uniref:hypothetical protein n=1 Tax=Streptomyces avermitilis TaxID=33903 RepID=UPI00369399A6